MRILKTSLWIGFFLISTSFIFFSDKPAHQVYNKKGNSVKYEKVIKKLADADVIFFGELHNNPISHWLQVEMTKSMYKKNNGRLILGAEMFEADNQLLLDEYLEGTIRKKDFEREARLWPNYDTDYQPLVEMARDSGLRFIASNIPRRYAAVVHKKGFSGLDSLSETAKQWIAPLPVEYDSTLSGYKKMMKMMKGMGAHTNPNLPKAQAIKDATMAHFIAVNMKTDHQFIHYNGAYHSNNFEGIVWYLKRKNPDLNIKTITTVEQAEVEDLEEESEGLADYIIVVDEDMTKTH